MLSPLPAFYKSEHFKRFAIALFVSLLVHLYFIQGFNINLPSSHAVISLVEVRLVGVPKPVITQEKPLQPVKTEPTKFKPAKKKQVSTKPKVPTPEQVLPEQPSEQPLPITPSQADAISQPEQLEQAEAAVQEETTMQNESATELPVDGEKVPPYKKIVMQYDVTTGVSASKIGQVKVQYEAHAEGTYHLTSLFEPSFLASMFVSKLSETSQGRYDQHGLKPEVYDYKFDNKTYQARFDWENHKISMHTGKGDRVAELSENAQDLLSFMFQFMYVPPLEEMQLAITTGKKFKTYTYTFEGEETIKTQMAEFRTIHIMNASGDEQEKTELWLAIDYRNLPVRVRKTEKDGKVIEKIITHLETES